MSLKLPGRLIGASRAIALLIACSAVGALASCDTTAFISRKNRALTSVESTGVVGATCTYDFREEAYRLRFTARDTDRSQIEPGDRLVGFSVELGDTFSVNDIGIVGEQGIIYPAPDITCANDADCAAVGLSGFTCQRRGRDAGTDGVSETLVCGRAMNVVVQQNTQMAYNPRMPEDDNRRRDVVMMAANGRTLLGVLPSGRIDPRFGTDPDNKRTSAITQMFRRLAASESEFAATSRACLASFADSSASVRFDDGGVPGNCFRDLGDSGEVTDLTNRVTSVLTLPANLGMNYWAALQSGVDYLTRFGRDTADKHLVLFVDTDMTDADIRDEASLLGQTFERTSQLVQDAGVIVHVIQLDNSPTCPDPLGSVTSQVGAICDTCGSDGDCGGAPLRCGDVGGALSCLVTCRNDTDCSSGFTCEETTGANSDLIDLCMPVGGSCQGDCIDPDGDGYGVGAACLGFDCHEDNPSAAGLVAPVGPLTALSELACVSGGTYFYSESPDSLLEAFTNLGIVLPAQYEVALGVSDIGLVPLGQYKMAFTLTVSMDDRTETYDFGGAVSTSAGRADRRVTINLAGTCSADADCLPQLTCIGGECVPRASFGSAPLDGSGDGT